MKCLICRRRIGGPRWTLVSTGRSRQPMHLACRDVLHEASAAARPAIVASADPGTRARIIRATIAVVRIRSRSPR